MISGLGRALAGAVRRGAARRLLVPALLAGVCVFGGSRSATAQYFPGQLFGVNTSPSAIAVGDFNGDGKIDYVTANNSTIIVNLMKGDGSSSFSETYTFNSAPTGVFPAAVAVGDFNGDGKLDIAVVDGSSNKVAVFLNNGDGTFGMTPQTYAVGVGVASLALGDFNGDGKLDIVTANLGTFDPMTSTYSGSGLSVLINGVNGAFTANPDIPLPRAPLSVAAADINGDGKADLIYTQSNAYNAIGVLYGRGNGTFQNTVTVATDYAEARVIAIDLNGDGAIDLLTDAGGSNSYVNIYLNNGNGTFRPAQPYSVSGSVTDFAVADINSDGRPDIVAITSGSTLDVLTGAGNGTFGGPVSYDNGRYPQRLAIADVNGDGKPDILTTTNYFSYNDVSVTLNAGNGTFRVRGMYATGNNPDYVAIGDVNGDGKPDIVTANQTDGTVSVLLSSGGGTYGANTDYPTGGNPKWVALADLNGDGKLDIITANSSAGTVSVLIGNGDGTFKTKVDYSVGSAPTTVTISDANSDGKPDLIVTNASAGSVSILTNNGDGTFQSRSDYPVGYFPTTAVLADVNGDGKPDLLVLNGYANTVSVYIGNGDGTFKSRVLFTTGGGAIAMKLADVNNDGKLDIVTANTTLNTVSVLLGKGDGTFKAKVDYPVSGLPSQLAVADINGDGKLDIITSNSSNYTVSVLTGVGDGTFGPKSDYASDFIPQALAVADVNGDGKPDIVTVNSGSNTVSVLLNISVTQPTHTLLFENSQTNDLVMWQLSGATDTGARNLVSQGVPLTWKIVAYADITGNGFPALIWQNQVTDEVVYWQMNATQPTGIRGTLAPVGSTDWKLVAAADLNGDGKPDLIWQNTVNGDVIYWLLNGVTDSGNHGYITHGVPLSWKIVGVADMTGDGKNDLIWENGLTNEVIYWQMNGVTDSGIRASIAVPNSVPLAWRVAAVVDVTGDGKPDLIWQNSLSGNVLYWALNGPTFTGAFGLIGQGVPTAFRVVGLK